MNFVQKLQTKVRRKLYGNIVFHRNTSFHKAKSSKIFAENGLLEINKKWCKADPFPTLLVLGEHSTLQVNGTFKIYSGARIYVNEYATLSLGSGYINTELNLSCFEKIEIGHNVAISERVLIRDSDNHRY